MCILFVCFSNRFFFCHSCFSSFASCIYVFHLDTVNSEDCHAYTPRVEINFDGTLVQMILFKTRGFAAEDARAVFVAVRSIDGG
jgi:hypothetical protein